MSLSDGISTANGKLDALLGMVAKMQANGSGDDTVHPGKDRWPHSMKLFLRNVVNGAIDDAVYGYRKITGWDEDRSRKAVEEFIAAMKDKYGGGTEPHQTMDPRRKGDEFLNAVLALLHGHTIEAIKSVRMLTGLPLKEAKDIVDALRSKILDLKNGD